MRKKLEWAVMKREPAGAGAGAGGAKGRGVRGSTRTRRITRISDMCILYCTALKYGVNFNTFSETDRDATRSEKDPEDTWMGKRGIANFRVSSVMHSKDRSPWTSKTFWSENCAHFMTPFFSLGNSKRRHLSILS